MDFFETAMLLKLSLMTFKQLVGNKQRYKCINNSKNSKN